MSMTKVRRHVHVAVALLLLMSSTLQHVLCQVTLTSNLREGQRACVGEMLMFTCTVTGTDFLAWSSEAYIGANNAQLEFLSSDQEGKVLNGSSSSAMLVDVSGEGATRILLSTLRIRVLATPTTFVVTCLNINGVRSNISVSLLTGKPGAPLSVSAAEISRSRDECALLVIWEPPNDIADIDVGNYTVCESKGGGISTDGSSTLVIIRLPSESCMQGLLINVSATNRCGVQGPSSAYVKPNLLNTDQGTTGIPVVPTQPVLVVRNSGGVAIAALVISLLIVIILLMITALTCTCTCMYYRWYRKRSHENVAVRCEPVVPDMGPAIYDYNMDSSERTGQEVELYYEKPYERCCLWCLGCYHFHARREAQVTEHAPSEGSVDSYGSQPEEHMDSHFIINDRSGGASTNFGLADESTQAEDRKERKRRVTGSDFSTPKDDSFVKRQVKSVSDVAVSSSLVDLSTQPEDQKDQSVLHPPLSHSFAGVGKNIDSPMPGLIKKLSADVSKLKIGDPKASH